MSNCENLKNYMVIHGRIDNKMDWKKVYLSEDVYYIMGYSYIVVNNERIDISRRERNLLTCLINSPGRIIKIDTLMDRIWADIAGAVGDSVTDSSLRKLVSGLRKKIGDVKKPYRILMSEYGVGYSINILRIVDDNPIVIPMHQTKEKDYRILINDIVLPFPTSISEFPKRLYSYLVNHPDNANKYGNIHLTNNEKEYIELSELKKSFGGAEFYILSLYTGYFDLARLDTKENYKTLNSLLTAYKEIIVALNSGVEIISICFNGFEYEENIAIIRSLCEIAAYKSCNSGLTDIELTEYYYNKLTRGRKYWINSDGDIDNVLLELSKEIALNEYKPHGMYDLISNNEEKNIQLSRKDETENNDKYNFFNRYSDVKKLSVLNLAATSFVLGSKLAFAHEETDRLKMEFDNGIENGKISIDFVLVHPYSFAAREASRYKMEVEGRNEETDVEDIILANVTDIVNRTRKNPNLKRSIKLKLTDIALPYAFIMSSHEKRINNHIKIDMYSPRLNNDKKRPSFYIMENNPGTSSIYNDFRDTYENVYNHYSLDFDGTLDLKWLCNTEHPFIHRGIYEKGVQGHNRTSIVECIKRGYPLEVDLLELCDKIIVVGRGDELAKYGWDSSCSYQKLVNVLMDGREEIYTLDDFLNTVRNKVPIILEIKSNNIHTESVEYRNFVDALHKSFNKYLRNFSNPFMSNDSVDSVNARIAVHSTNPYIIRDLKLKNCMLPCGLISLDYSRIKENVDSDFLALHRIDNLKDTFALAIPDFISYDIISLDPMRCDSWEKNYLVLQELRSFKLDKKIPLILWTVHDSHDMKIVKQFDAPYNYILEGRSEI